MEKSPSSPALLKTIKIKKNRPVFGTKFNFQNLGQDNKKRAVFWFID
jgi:hypothetical protein